MFSFLNHRYQSALYLGQALKEWDPEWISFEFGLTHSGFFYEGLSKNILTEDGLAQLLKSVKDHVRAETEISVTEMVASNAAELFNHFGEPMFGEACEDLSGLVLIAKVGQTPFLMPEWVLLPSKTPFEVKLTSFKCEGVEGDYLIRIEGVAGEKVKPLEKEKKEAKKREFSSDDFRLQSPSDFWEVKQALKGFLSKIGRRSGYKPTDIDPKKGGFSLFLEDLGDEEFKAIFSAFGIEPFFSVLQELGAFMPLPKLRVLCKSGQVEDFLLPLLKKSPFAYEIEKTDAITPAMMIYPFYPDDLGRLWQIGHFVGDLQKKTLKGAFTLFENPIEFLDYLLFQGKGALPFAFAPAQFALIPLEESSYAQKVLRRLESLGFRTRFLGGEEPLSKKIYRAEKEGIPYTIVLGSKEEKQNLLSLRGAGSEEIKALSFEELLVFLDQQLESQQLENQPSN